MKKANTAIYIPNMDADKFEKICNEKGLQFVYVSVPAHVRPVARGKWKHDKDGLVWCLNCGFGKERSDERTYHFCPNCGADMREES